MQKKIPPPVERQLIESLDYILTNRSSASRVIKYTLSRNKKWGSRDRRVFAECFYDILRNLRSYAFLRDIDSRDLNFSNEQLSEIIQVWKEEEKTVITDLEDVKYSCSPVLFNQLKKEFTEKEVRVFLKASQLQAYAFLRVNELKTNTKELMESLAAEEVETLEVKENCLKLVDRKSIFMTKAFKEGLFEMQDGASQDVAPFLEVEPGHRVIDSCAGAGGKTLHIASIMRNKGKIIAMDVFEKRLEELKKRSKRAGAHNIEMKLIQGTKTIKRLEESADRLLLDVPCTGTGVYRRKPESKLFFTEEEHTRLNGLQREIIASHSRMLKKGGKMIYATCSILPSENMQVVEEFLKDHPSFALEKAVTHRVGKDGFDGFFMAKMRRD